jgi:hypothetical protein
MNNVFEALPHIDEIWVTEDGHFHLHPNNGGKKVTRPLIKVQEQEVEKPVRKFKK